jgi:YesN/AraC family two-component response regulator
MGTTFVEYINIIRIKEAKILLKETDSKIIEIAYKVGFNNVTYFNLIFKKITGQTPFEFRKGSLPF